MGSNFQCGVLQDQKICHRRVPCGYRSYRSVIYLTTTVREEDQTGDGHG